MSEAKKPPPKCVDCRHYLWEQMAPPYERERMHLCRRPELLDLVTGQPKACRSMRYGVGCGEEGRLFEPASAQAVA